MRRDKVSRLMQKWRNHCLEADTDSGIAESDKVGQESDKTPPQVPEIAQLPEVESDKSRTLVGQESDNTYIPKAEAVTETKNIHTSLPQGEATPPPNPLPSKAKAKSDSLTELARALWPKLVAEAALGGKVWVAKPRNLQLKAITTRLEEYGEENILLAVQGYRAKAQGADGDWDAMKYFDITSILRPSNIEGNIAAAPGSEVDSWAEAERAIKRRMAEATEAEADNLVRFDFKTGGK